ncbi:MAG: PIN domain nuclease [Actinomycetota bacterium]
MTASYLVDTSAFARYGLKPVKHVLDPLLEAGGVATCSVVVMELLFSARSAADMKATRGDLRQALDLIPTNQANFDRAIEVMQALSDNGLHRAAPLPDLLIAAVGEAAGLEIIHYDEDFDLISRVTGQPVRWVAPKGSL